MKRGIWITSLFLTILIVAQSYALDQSETRSYNDLYNNPKVKFFLASDVSVKYEVEMLSSIPSEKYIGTEWNTLCGVSYFTRDSGLEGCMPSDAWVRFSFEDENGKKFTSSEFYVPANAAGKLVILVYKNGESQWTIGQTDRLIQYFPKEAGNCLFVDSNEDKYDCFKSFADQGADAQTTCNAESTSNDKFANINVPFMENFRNQCFYVFSTKQKDPLLCNQMNIGYSKDYCYYYGHEKYDFEYYSVWLLIGILPIILYLGLFFLIKKVKNYSLKYSLFGLLIAEILIGYLRYLMYFIMNPLSRAAFYLIGSGLFTSLQMYSQTYLVGLPCKILTRCSGEGCMICFLFFSLPLILFGLIGLIIGRTIKDKNWY